MLDALEEAGIAVEEASLSQPTLDDAFFALAGERELDGGMTATLNEVRFLAGRSLRHIPRIPEKAFGAVLLPLVFVLLFAYVFGSAIEVPGGGDYHAYLVSGIFAQTMIGTVPGIAVGVASDIRSGLMDRLRTLPIARGSVIAGRTVAELVELCGGMVVVALCGLIVGWAPHGTVLETIGAFGLLLLMAFAVTWAGVWLGLMVRDPDGADGIAMAVIFPVMFLSGIFVPGRRPAGRAAPDRRVQPADRRWPPRCASSSARPSARCRTSGTLQHPSSRRWAGRRVLMAIFVPLSIRRYQRMGVTTERRRGPGAAWPPRRGRRARPACRRACRRGSARG